MINNKCGVSIYVAIFCLLLFSSLSFMLCSLVATHTESAANYSAAEQALHIAEAGRQYSIWRLTTQDQSWITSETSEKSLGPGTYTLRVYDDVETDKKIVISTGYVPNGSNPRAKRIVKLEGSYGIEEGTHPIYNYALYTDNAASPSWPVNALINLILNPNTEQSTTFSITENSADTITTAGDMTTVATTGDPYDIYAEGTSTGLTTTVLTDSSASWTADIFKGRDLNPNTTQGKSFTITENTTTTITVIGNLTEVATTGDTYKVVYDSGTSTNLIATVLTDTITLIFDANKYTLSTDKGTDGDADVHSNNDITFRNGTDKVVEGTVYSAKNVIKEPSWSGTPWNAYEEEVDTICPPYLEDVTRDYYRERAIEQGNYYSGDKTFTGFVELGTSFNPALIYVEGKIKIGNAKYHRPGSTTTYGVGTIVSGGGDITIFGSIEPCSGARCKLALVSFYDTKYQYEIVEPPYTEGKRKLDIQDDDEISKLIFDNEYVNIIYENDKDVNSKYGFLTVMNHSGTLYLDEVSMDREGDWDPGYTFKKRFDISTWDPDWYYFRVRITKNSNGTDLKRQFYGYFIVDEPSPTYHIKTYSDSGFSEETSGFDDGDTVYLEIYAVDPSTTTINTLEISDYALATDEPTLIDDTPATNYIRCHFTLPSLTTGYWYNLYVETSNPTTYFHKQFYVKSPPGTTEIYACSHSNCFFRLEEEESTELNIIGNLTANHGFKIKTTAPLSSVVVTYDTRLFRQNKYDENALPGAAVFNYTWKEE